MKLVTLLLWLGFPAAAFAGAIFPALQPAEGLWRWSSNDGKSPMEVKYLRPAELPRDAVPGVVRGWFEVRGSADRNSPLERYGLIAAGTDQVFMTYRKGVSPEVVGMFVGSIRTSVDGVITEMVFTSIGNDAAHTVTLTYLPGAAAPAPKPTDPQKG